MRIAPLSEPVNTELRKADAVKKAADKPAKRPFPADRTEFSSQSTRLSDAKAESEVMAAHIANQPDVRPEKIAEVKHKIENGFYDTEEFADKLADKLLEEFGIKKP
jgi:flagellar biosynthesis anti-sigma factor FlgM